MTPTETAGVAPPKLMTADDFWDFVHLPENESRSFELRMGEVIELSRPSVAHCRVCFRVGLVIEQYAEQVGRGYAVTNDPGVLLREDPDTVVGPDAAYFTDAASFGDIVPKWAVVPPLLAVEVRSPNDRPNVLIAKVGDYLRNGVRLVWLVDYEDRTVSVFRPNRTPEVYAGDQVIHGGDELPGFTGRVSEFFRVPGERPTPPPQPPAA